MSTFDIVGLIIEGVAIIVLLVAIPYMAHLLTPPAEPKDEK